MNRIRISREISGNVTFETVTVETENVFFLNWILKRRYPASMKSEATSAPTAGASGQRSYKMRH